MKEVDDVLLERSATHGSFKDHAHITQELKAVVRQGQNWHKLTDVQTEALEMILHKIGRVLSGNQNHQDHWTDIAGYSRLVERECDTGGRTGGATQPTIEQLARAVKGSVNVEV